LHIVVSNSQTSNALEALISVPNYLAIRLASCTSDF